MWHLPMAVSLAEQPIAARTQKARTCFVFLRPYGMRCSHGLAADTGPALESGAWGLGARRAWGLALATLGQASATSVIRTRCAHRAGQALADGGGRSRRRAAALQSRPPGPLPPAAPRAPGQDVAGADGRLGGADRGLRRQATARRLDSPLPAVPAGWRTRSPGAARRCGRPWAARPRPWARPPRCAWPTRDGSWWARAVATPRWSSMGGPPRTGQRAAPGPGGGGAVETLARAAAMPRGAGAAPCRRCWRP